ncbi:hypothetical protein FXO37_34823 [Capsicum annuum]|nr:hypothetical protein FXO37_34823 [Capsicum annuum]
MVDQLDQVDSPIDLLEYTSTNEKSFISFNKEWDKEVHEENRVAEKRGESGHFNETPTTVGYIELENEVAPAQSTANKVVASVDLDHKDQFVEDDAGFESDVHEKDINLRAEIRTYHRRKRRETIPNDPKEVPLGEVGPDLEFDETEIVDKSLKDKVSRDVPVCCISDLCSVESDSKDELGRTNSRKVVCDKSTKQVVWQLGKDVSQFRDVTKYALQEDVQLEKYEILRSNPDCTCAVKVDNSDDSGSTFKDEMKKNLNQMAMQGGKDIIPDLLHYKILLDQVVLLLDQVIYQVLQDLGGGQETLQLLLMHLLYLGKRSRITSNNPEAPSRPKGKPRKKTQAEKVATPPTPRERPDEPTATNTPAAQAAPNARVRGRNVDHVAKDARVRGKGVEQIAGDARGKGRDRNVEHIAGAARFRGRGRSVTPVTTASRGRGRPRKIPLDDIGVAKRTPLYEWFENPTSYTTITPPNPPASHIYAPLNPPISSVDAQFKSCDRGATDKRPKAVGMGVLIAENDFTTYNVSANNKI